MVSSRALLVEQPAERFAQIVSASPKKFREELFRRAGVRAKKGGNFSLNNAKKNEVRTEKLRQALADGADIGPEVLDELVRNYLYTRRPLLAEALDFFEVEHDEGLTDVELEFVEDLPEERVTHLRDLLKRNHDEDDVELYLRFMKIA